LKLERIISLTLRIGVISSSLLVVAGLALYLISGAKSFIPTSELSGIQVIKLLTQGSPEGIILTGVMVLIFTPVVRVLELLFDYAWAKDKIYAILSLAVLTLMLFGIFMLPIIR
jgi:uncharacterized membrane protein